MEKKYIVRLSEAERSELQEIINRLTGTSQKVRRAQVLLKADANTSNWTDLEIADAFGCRTKTVENIRQRFVTEGSKIALNGRKRDAPPVAKKTRRSARSASDRCAPVRLGSAPKGVASCGP